MAVMQPADRRAFILAETRLIPVAHVPEISLHVADEALDIWQKTEDQLAEIGLPAPFWAFAWAGGQALARYVLDTPDIVRGRTVLDFASGSGLVAIAAMMAGARKAVASEIDDFALEAIRVNAEANGVEVEVAAGDLTETEGGDFDIVFAGDVFYERPMAEKLLPWLDGFVSRGVPVLVGDPGRAYLPKGRLGECATYQVPVVRDLEDSEIRKTTVWRLDPPAAA